MRRIHLSIERALVSVLWSNGKEQYLLVIKQQAASKTGIGSSRGQMEGARMNSTYKDFVCTIILPPPGGVRVF